MEVDNARDFSIDSTSDYDSAESQELITPKETSANHAPIYRDYGPQTGPKGVIADYKHSKTVQYEAHLDKLAEKKRFINTYYGSKQSNPVRTMWQKEEPTELSSIASERKSMDSCPISDFEIDKDLDEIDSEEERILNEYKKEKLLKLQGVSENTPKSLLVEMSAVKYAEYVDSLASKDVYIVVLLHFKDYPVSERFKTMLEKLVVKYPQHKFIKVDAKECGFDDYQVMPILLVYLHGKLIGNHVRASSMLESFSKFDEKMIDSVFISVL
ncbi:hypothetical protein BB560_000989 [Smittium megazygosporum]|uniref:Phosducin domain-containing protein n=1 Tax=Smittium megazygosporum TaxID=133381 RepID=A0A2T9ZIV1_9FUNG|nr:hypothetical protein BB560_000989 [Smittium megazygosporum]